MAAIRRNVGEKKGLDTDLTTAAVLATTNTNGDTFVLNLVVPGSGSWNRTGRKIFLKSLRIKGTAIGRLDNTAGVDTTQSNTLRMVIVWDKQPSGAAIPTFDTIFGRTNQAGTEATQFLDPPRYDNMSRFQVLKDCTYDFNPASIPGAATTSIDTCVSFDEYIKLKSRETTYGGQSDPQTIADISTGALYLIFRARTNIAGTALVVITDDTFARLRYTDP